MGRAVNRAAGWCPIRGWGTSLPSVTVKRDRLNGERLGAGKEFDKFVLPNRNHKHADEPYVVRKQWRFFARHLHKQPQE